MLKCYHGHNLSYNVRCLILCLRDLIAAPFACCELAFPPPCQNPLSFFPNLQCRERGYTKLTTTRSVMTKMPAESTPPAMQCRHQEFWLFSADIEFVMVFRWWSHTKIFLCRFPVPPQMITYDNECKRHQCFKPQTCSLQGQVPLARTCGMFKWLLPG